MNKWNNKFRYQVASCWLFILSYTTMHGSMSIKSIQSCSKIGAELLQIWQFLSWPWLPPLCESPSPQNSAIMSHAWTSSRSRILLPYDLIQYYPPTHAQALPSHDLFQVFQLKSCMRSSTPRLKHKIPTNSVMKIKMPVPICHTL